MILEQQSVVHTRAVTHMFVATFLVFAVGDTSFSAELRPATAAAFERYVGVSEDRMAAELANPNLFLFVDGMPEQRRRPMMSDLRAGKLVIERRTAEDLGKDVDVPGGLVHHWVGLVFVPRARVDQAVALLQDYDRHAEIYHPAVARSKLLTRNNDTFRVHLRFFMKKGITVVLNSEHEARYTQAGPERVYSRIVSTRIAEVEDPGTPGEREKPAGRDGGYLWRLNTYWRFLERDAGTYVQCESISLTRGIPVGLGWLIGPFVTSIPRESLEFTLETTRKVLAKSG
jgi:hypothetical protein